MCLSLPVDPGWRSGCDSGIWGACTSMHTSAGAPPPMQAFLGANVGLSGRKQGALRIGFGENSKGNSGRFSSMICCLVAQSCPTVCDPMDCSTQGFPILHHLPEFVQIHVHGVSEYSRLISFRIDMFPYIIAKSASFLRCNYLHLLEADIFIVLTMIFL